MKTKLLCLLLCLTAILSVGTTAASAGKTYTVAEVESLCDGIVGYKEKQCGASSVQRWIDTGLSGAAGVSAEFYIIALSQSDGYDFSSYENALLQYLNNNEVYSATSREKYALALIASGSNNGYISRVTDEAIGGQGLMSLVFGLHILNNGYKSKQFTSDSLIRAILGNQLSDGGWAVIGDRGDTDVTAMTLQALAPHYRSRSDVNAAVNRALTMLSDAQKDDGGFFGMGVENCESAAQVLCALSDLGIDQNTDKRFIKNGNTVLDAMIGYRNADGSFSHTGGGFNETATVQAYYSMTAYLRFLRGKGPLYVLDNRHPGTVEPAQQPTRQPQTEPPKAPQTEAATQKPQTDHPQAQRQTSPTVSHQSGGQNTQSGQNAATESGQNAPQNSQGQQTPAAQQNQAGGQTYNNAADSGGRQITASSATEAKKKPTEKATEKPTEQKKQKQTEALSDTSTERDAGKGAGMFQPTATATEPTVAEDAPPAEKGSYKPYAIGGILAAAGIAALVLFLLKKRNKKHYIAVGILAAAGILFVLLTNFESPQSYHAVAEKADTTGTVTLTVRCDTLTDEEMPDTIPDNGVILGETEFAIAGGDTVYDILLEASKRYDFQVDNRGAAGVAYIAGIAYLYEFDYGELSGWMYRVNGTFPDVGCQSCTLHDGDKIEWLYTKNIGKDLA